jgi:vacuolar-type H+-ATPase subunit I/STV1
MSPRGFARLDKLIWQMIYAGLFLVILGLASASRAPTAAWSMGILGAVLAIAGAILIPVRARLREDAANDPPERQP